MPPALPPQALAGGSDDLTDDLDNVSLAELKAPVASAYLTGTLPGARAARGAPHWLWSWSTLFVAGGTVLGLLFAWGVVSAPTLYREHVRPYFEKHVASAFGQDPARQLVRIFNDLINVGDSMAQTLRQINNVESARRVMPQYIEVVMRLGKLEDEAETLKDATGRGPRKAEMDTLKARLSKSQEAVKAEMARCTKIPGVGVVLAQALSDAAHRDARLAETLKKTPQGRMLLASSEAASGDQQGTAAASGPPLPQAPPVPQAAPRNAFPATVPPPVAMPRPGAPTTGNTGLAPTDATGDATPGEPAQSASDAAQARQYINALFHITALQKNLIDRSEKIIDNASLAKHASLWASATVTWQSRQEALTDIAGLDFRRRRRKSRYLETKETSDRQQAQIDAEFSRLEKLGLLPKLNVQLVKQGGKAVGSAGTIADDDDDRPGRVKRPAPPALRRVPK